MLEMYDNGCASYRVFLRSAVVFTKEYHGCWKCTIMAVLPIVYFPGPR
jgi:hypothetical protein